MSHYTVEKPRFWNDLVLFCQPLKFNFLPRAPDLVLSPTVLIEAALSLLSCLSWKRELYLLGFLLLETIENRVKTGIHKKGVLQIYHTCGVGVGLALAMPALLSCFSLKSLQSCQTLCEPIDYSLPVSSVHGNLQARILEWVAISFSMATLRDSKSIGVGPFLSLNHLCSF